MDPFSCTYVNFNQFVLVKGVRGFTLTKQSIHKTSGKHPNLTKNLNRTFQKMLPLHMYIASVFGEQNA